MHHLINGDCRIEMAKFENEFFDLCITSPPYKNENEYSEELIRHSFQEIYRLLKKNTLFYLNFGALANDKFRPFRVCQIALEIGFKLNDTIIWVKNHYKPIQGRRRVNNLSEFIFVLYKGEMPELNRLAIGIPYVDKSNAKRFNGGLNLHCAGNVWYINYETINHSDQKPHPDRFPTELPLRCIKLCGYPITTILDPFCGSGTTGLASKILGKKFIGIEKDNEIYQRAISRLSQEITVERESQERSPSPM